MKKLILPLFVLGPAFAFSQQVAEKLPIKTPKESEVRIGAPTNVLVFINNYEIDAKDFNKLNPKDIISVNVFKAKDYLKEYGEKAKNGIIRLEAKQEAFSKLVEEGLIKPIL